MADASSPKISVLVVSRRSWASLGQAIESVCNQSYSNIHVIMVRDGRVPQEWEQLPQRFPRRTFELILPHHIGIAPRDTYVASRTGALRNIGMERVESPYAAFLDDDNSFSCDHFSSLFQLMKAEHLDGVFSARKVFWPNKEPYLEHRYPWPVRGMTPTEAWRYFEERGVVTPGTNEWQDIFGFDGDDVLTVDTSEWLLPTEIWRRFPFQTTYTEKERWLFRGNDYMFGQEMLHNRIRARSTRKPTLRYYLGGFSNERSIQSRCVKCGQLQTEREESRA